MLAVWQRARRLIHAHGFEVEWRARPQSRRSRAAADFANALDELVQREREPHPLWIEVREAFRAIASVQGCLAGLEPLGGDGEELGRLLIAAAQLGQVDVKLGLWEIGLWRDYASAKAKLSKIANAPRNRIAPWVLAFAPVAVEFCAGTGESQPMASFESLPGNGPRGPTIEPP